MPGHRRNDEPLLDRGATTGRRTAAGGYGGRKTHRNECQWERRLSTSTQRVTKRRRPSSTSTSAQRSTRKAWTFLEMAWTPTKPLGMILEWYEKGKRRT
eukprot:scaffold826_cov335-Pavlova_lutheri.AAC.21